MLLTQEEQKEYVARAMQQAREALARGDEPYGAIIIDSAGKMLSAAGNEENSRCDPTAHAEIMAIRAAARVRGEKSLTGCTVICNYKPCPMCAAAMLMTGIREIYVGSSFDGMEALFLQTAAKLHSSSGGETVSGIAAEECAHQVALGRKQLKDNNPAYQSGHKNGII